jgi:hypothetical protein
VTARVGTDVAFDGGCCARAGVASVVDSTVRSAAVARVDAAMVGKRRTRSRRIVEIMEITEMMDIMETTEAGRFAGSLRSRRHFSRECELGTQLIVAELRRAPHFAAHGHIESRTVGVVGSNHQRARSRRSRIRSECDAARLYDDRPPHPAFVIAESANRVAHRRDSSTEQCWMLTVYIIRQRYQARRSETRTYRS